jgi:hypothetical protein
MSSAWRSAVESLVADLRRIFGTRLHSVSVYGAHATNGTTSDPIHCLALVASITAHDLSACAHAARGWHKHGLATPLILTGNEFRESLDAFPLEYGEIIHAHTLVTGTDPFAEAAIEPDDLRRACETQVKSHLVHLREAFIEAGGKPHAIADLVAASAPAFMALLRHVARLHEADGADRVHAAQEGARLAGLPEALVGSLLALERPHAMGPTDAARLFPEYLAAVERLASFVDTWHT